MKKILSFLTAILMGFLPLVSAATAVATTEAEMWKKAQDLSIYYDGGAGAECAGGTIDGSQVTVIGDSIAVGAESEFSSQIPGADFEPKTLSGTTYNLVEVSKHFATNAGENYGGTTIAKVLNEQSALKPYVVFALGTNDAGSVTDSVVNGLLDEIGTNHKIVFVTNYAVDNANDYSVNNAAFKKAASENANVAVADWAATAAENPGQYISDGYVHPSAAGSQVYVKLIKQALNSLAGSVAGVSTGGNRNYAGAQVWSEAELDAIEANFSVYSEAASLYDLPWQVLAVLHRIETGLQRYNPANGQGAYQLYSYTAGGTNANRFEPSESISEAEFLEQTKLVASMIAEKGVDWNDAGQVKRFFFGYNGTSSQYIEKAIAMGFSEEEAANGEGSPYVMNRYDARRDPTSGEMDAAWAGRYTADGVYTADSTSTGFGAFVLYEALTGTSYCSAAGGSIAEVARALAWDLTNGEKHDKNDPKPEYVAAMKEVGTYTAGCHGGGTCAPIGASCDQFVSTVMRYSGADADFPAFGPGRQEAYMVEHSEMYSLIETGEDVSALLPGDIFVTAGSAGNHIYIYVGEDLQASASFNDRTGELFSGVYFSDNGGARVYKVYRRIQ